MSIFPGSTSAWVKPSITKECIQDLSNGISIICRDFNILMANHTSGLMEIKWFPCKTGQKIKPCSEQIHFEAQTAERQHPNSLKFAFFRLHTYFSWNDNDSVCTWGNDVFMSKFMIICILPQMFNFSTATSIFIPILQEKRKRESLRVWWRFPQKRFRSNGFLCVCGWWTSSAPSRMSGESKSRKLVVTLGLSTVDWLDVESQKSHVVSESSTWANAVVVKDHKRHWTFLCKDIQHVAQDPFSDKVTSYQWSFECENILSLQGLLSSKPRELSRLVSWYARSLEVGGGGFLAQVSFSSCLASLPESGSSFSSPHLHLFYVHLWVQQVSKRTVLRHESVVFVLLVVKDVYLCWQPWIPYFSCL